MNFYKKILVDNLALVIQYFFGGVTVFYVTPLIVKSIGITNYGLLALISAIVTYMALVIQFSFGMIGPKLIAENKDEKSHVFSTILSAKLTLFVIVTCVFLVYFLFFQSQYSNVYLLFLFIPLSWVFNSAWYLQATNKFIYSSICSIVGSLVTLILALLLLKKSNDLTIPIICLTISAVVNGGLTFLCSLKDSLVIRFNKPTAILKNGSSLFLSQLISALYTMSGVFVISHFNGMESSGLYAVVEKFMNLFISLGMLTHIAAYPKLAQLFRTDYSAYKKLIKFVIGIYALYSISILLIVFLFANHIQNYMFNDSGVYTESKHLLYSGCLYIFVCVFGPIMTGYLTLQNSGRTIIILNLLIAIFSILFGVTMLKVLGSPGWLVGLSLAQMFNILFFIKTFFWRSKCAG
ncbi:oligosaccharide flippase family protein [Leclercia adecarboxylata]|uniref:Putative O-antigen transporter n=2 Tax=Leclercia adecarboxylata TaxID=83655 RepID=A0A9X3YD41_9ENTR|nr:oligosaccharide flippase family protein [Leclercia adecarboxylata]MBD1403458.1 oligosaccharide flippase family protein [Leclercia adecarboxylata]MDC6621087.1 oligosaccharide flippase family protein [Leclercia adecarboxylata]MDC6631662.1 oligosaccharide flippase family protein [Leclercia adecarboxylata]MDC6640452.1 oligosaccharide flippase family protein [Leclercia adecarboxylata]MDC6652353.1 oligosaccharide flippase family protein [Leclercia adecarboxylata]